MSDLSKLSTAALVLRMDGLIESLEDERAPVTAAEVRELCRRLQAQAVHPDLRDAINHLLTIALNYDEAGSPLHAAAKDVRMLMAVHAGVALVRASPPPPAATGLESEGGE